MQTDSRLAEDFVWADFASAQTPAAYCRAWLAMQCRAIDAVRCGLLLIEQDEHTYLPAAVWPDRLGDFDRLGQLAQRCIAARSPLTESASAGATMLGYPVEADQRVVAAVVLELSILTDDAVGALVRHLRWGTGWLVALRHQGQAEHDLQGTARARIALEALAQAGENRRLTDAALAIANHLAARLGCKRVTIGIERKGRIRLLAISHSAWFDRNSQVVQTIENAMDEAFDQGKSVTYPPLPEGAHAIAVAHHDLAGPGAVCSAVITSRGRAIGVMTLERAPGAGFSAADVELCEAAATMIGPLMEMKAEAERWFAGRFADWLRRVGQVLADPRRPSMRLAALAIVATVLALVFVQGEYRVTAKAVVEGEVQRAAVAPFDGYVAEALVRAGQTVKHGEVLARLDDRDLRVEQQKWSSEREQHERRYRDALAKHERSSARVLAAQIAEADAQLELVEERLARTRVAAPFDGLVVSGDLSQMLGSPVQQGKVLFEIAPLDAYCVVLKVDERDVRSVTVGQRGQMILTGGAAEPLPFVVKNISVATAEDGRNLFRVEAQIEGPIGQLRPGMEGVGKISAGERGLWWIWTHRFGDWLRMLAWNWLP